MDIWTTSDRPAEPGSVLPGGAVAGKFGGVN